MPTPGMSGSAGDGRVRADVTATEVRISPGEPAYVEVEVTNVTEVIRSYRVDVLGLDPQWAVADAVDLELFPGERRATTLSFQLPVTFPAGRRRIAIEVTEPGTPDGSVVVVDVDVFVEARDELSFGVEPSSMTVGPEGTFVVTPINSGNTTLDLELVAADPERKVQVTFDPPRPRLLPGERSAVKATVRGPRPWFGMPLVRVLEFRLRGGSAEAFTAAAFIQTPRFSRRAVSMAGLVVVATLFAFVIFLSFGSVADLSAQQEALLKQSLGEDQPIGVRVDPSSIAGRVTSTTGGGIDGVSVELYTAANPLVPAKSTVTDSTGTFRFGSLLADTYYVRFQVAGFGETWFRRGTSILDATGLELVAGQDLVDVDVSLGGQPGTIVGTVVGEDVDGALVVAQIPGASIEGSTLAPVAARLASAVVDVTGQFRLEGLPTPAAYEVVVSKAGFAPQVRTISLEPGEERRDLEILLRRGGGVIAGTVTDLNGLPIPGAVVIVSDGQTTVATRTLSESDVLGTFDIRELPTPGTYALTVTSDGFFSETQTILLAQDQRIIGRRVALTASLGSVTGRVVDSAGVPLGGIEISVLGPGLNVSTQSLSVPVGWDPAVDGAVSKRFDASGRRIIDENGYPVSAGTWRITGLPLPGAYTVSYAAPGVLTQAVSVELTPGAGAVRAVPTAVLDPSSGTIQGRVVEQCSAPGGECRISAADGVVVTLRSSTLQRTISPTDLPVERKGSFRFDNVPPGSYTLTVTRPGSPTQTILVNTTTLPRFSFDFLTQNFARNPSLPPYGPIVMERPALITGRIVPYEGFLGSRRYLVSVFTPDTIGLPFQTPIRTGFDGTFTLAGLPAPGLYVLQFEDLETGARTLIPSPEQTTATPIPSQVLELEPGVTLDVNVEMAGAGATSFSPFVSFVIRPTGPIPILTVRPTDPEPGDLYVDGLSGRVFYFTGDTWASAGRIDDVPESGSVSPGDADYPTTLTVVGPPGQHGAPAGFVFVTQPTNTTWQQFFGDELREYAPLADITVRLVDSIGRTITTGQASTAALHLGIDPSAGGLRGTLVADAVAGTATFRDLGVLLAGNGYRLLASGAGAQSTPSAAFNVASLGGTDPAAWAASGVASFNVTAAPGQGPDVGRTIVTWGAPFTTGGSTILRYEVVDVTVTRPALTSVSGTLLPGAGGKYTLGPYTQPAPTVTGAKCVVRVGFAPQTCVYDLDVATQTNKYFTWQVWIVLAGPDGTEIKVPGPTSNVLSGPVS